METKMEMETSNQVNQADPEQGYFRHESLDAYALARRATQIVAAHRSILRGLPGQAGPQLERAVVGAQTNLASGAAHYGLEAKRHFRTALSEATEAGAVTDIVYDFKAFTIDQYKEMRSILLRLCATLRGLSR